MVATVENAQLAVLGTPAALREEFGRRIDRVDAPDYARTHDCDLYDFSELATMPSSTADRIRETKAWRIIRKLRNYHQLGRMSLDVSETSDVRLELKARIGCSSSATC